MAFRMDVARQDDWFVGETKRLLVTVWADKAKTSRQDVTGWEFTYDFYEDGSKAFSRSSGDGIAVSDAPGGEIVVVIPGEDTSALDDLSNLHHVLNRSDAGNEGVLGIGDVILNDPAEA